MDGPMVTILWIQTNLVINQKWGHRHRKQANGYQSGKAVGRNKIGIWD